MFSFDDDLLADFHGKVGIYLYISPEKVVLIAAIIHGICNFLNHNAIWIAAIRHQAAIMRRKGCRADKILIFFWKAWKYDFRNFKNQAHWSSGATSTFRIGWG